MNELQNYVPMVWDSPIRGKLLYRFRKPERMEFDKKYPLLLFFHGAGGRGNDNSRQLIDAESISAFQKQNLFSNYSSHLIAGQVPENKKWVNVDWASLEHEIIPISSCMRMTFELVDTYIAARENQVDLNRIYVMGISMGGYGTWDAIHRRPDFFAAAVPICGGGDKTRGNTLSNIPIWSWHGVQDDIISVQRSRDMHIEIKTAGGFPKYTEIKGRGHDVWNDVWDSKKLWEWLYAQKKN